MPDSKQKCASNETALLIGASSQISGVNVGSVLTICAWGVWLVGHYILETNSSPPESVIKFGFAASLIALCAAESLGKKYYSSFDIALLVALALFAISARQAEDSRLFQLLLIIYVLRDVDFRVLQKITFLLLSAALLTTLLLFAIGMIPDVVIGEGTSRVRSSLGFVYPSRAGSYLLSICMAYICWKQDNARPYVLFFMLAIAASIYAFTNARNPLLLTGLLFVGWFIARNKRIDLSSGIKPIAFALIPFLLFFVTALLALCYDSEIPWMKSLDLALAHRLEYSHNAFCNSEIHAFGNSIYNDGTFAESTGYLDAGYLRLLFAFGPIVTVIMLACLTALVYNLARYNRKYLLVVMMCVLFRSTVDAGFLLLTFTPVLFAMFNEDFGIYSSKGHMRANLLFG